MSYFVLKFEKEYQILIKNVFY